MRLQVLAPDLEQQLKLGGLMKEGNEDVLRAIERSRTSEATLYIGYDFRFECVTLTERMCD